MLTKDSEIVRNTEDGTTVYVGQAIRAADAAFAYAFHSPLLDSEYLSTEIMAVFDEAQNVLPDIYAVLGGNSLWWCTSDKYGFFSKLVRLVPFALFVAFQILQVYFFKGAVEEHIGKELSMKSTFICLILTFPVALVLSIILGVAGVSNETLNVVVSIVFFALVLGGIGWALMRNVRTVGWRQGAAFTAFSVVCVVAVCLAVFLFIVALIELFLQILTASVIVIAGIYAYSLMSKGQQVEQPKMMFRDKDGHLHVDSISRDNADKKIDERRENNK